MRKIRNEHLPGLFLVLTIAVSISFFVSCEAVFTFSPLSGLQRDPSSLSEEQKIVFAQNALSAGDASAALAAYNALKDSTSASAKVLAADCALLAAGLPDTLSDILDGIAAGETDMAGLIDASIADMDMTLVDGAYDLVDGVKNDGVAGADQMITTGVARLMSLAQTAGGAGNLDPADPDVDAALTLINTGEGLLEPGSATADLVAEIEGYFLI